MSTHVRKIPYTYKGKTQDMWLVVWKDLKGTPREKRFKNKRHADEYRVRIDRELSDNIHVADRAAVTIGKVGEVWLKDCEQRWNTIDRKTNKRGLAGNTYQSYLSIWKNHTKPRLAHIKLNNKRLHHEVQGFVNELGTKYDVGGVPKQVKMQVWNILEFAVYEDLIPRNPIRDKTVELPGEPHRRGGDEIPTTDEALKLITRLHQTKPPHEKKLDWAQKQALITLAMFGGLRSGECAALQWSNVDFNKRDPAGRPAPEIKVRFSWSKYDGIKPPKSKAGIRDVPMNPILHNVLKRYAAFMGHRSGLLFRTQSGTKPYARWVQNHMNDAMRSAELFDPSGAVDWQGKRHPKFTFHGLRHFAGSAWLAQGMNLKHVSWLLGHASTRETERTYLHQLKDDDHARQIMNTQITKFPGIPHSGVITEPSLPAIAPPTIELLVDEPKQIVDMSQSIEPNGALYEPIPVAVPELSGLEVVPTVIIPEKAPHYVPYAIRLLQSGQFEVRDVAKEIGITASRLGQVFTELGMDSPGVIRWKAREARIQYHRDHNKTLKEAARIENVNITTAWRIEDRLKSQGVEMVPRRPGGRKRKPLPAQVIETKGENAISEGQNAGNVREKQFKLL